MKEKLQNPPIIGMIILIILSTLVLLIKTGSESLERKSIESYLNKHESLLTDETEKQLEEYLITKGVSTKIAKYINDSSTLKKEINNLILGTYDYYVYKKPLDYSKENIINIIRIEVKKYELDYNQEVWIKVGPEIEKNINDIMEIYENEVIPSLGIIFKIFSDGVWKTLLVIMLITIIIMTIFKKTWALLYSSVALFSGFLFNLYILTYTNNLYSIGGITISNKLLEQVKNKAASNNDLIMFLSIIILVIFLILQVIIKISKRQKMKKEIAKL